MSKHTPGPWGCILTSYHAHDYRLINPNGTPMLLMIEANDHSEQRANARLIAAAPDLLEALTECLQYGAFLPPPIVNVARSALDKATGKVK